MTRWHLRGGLSAAAAGAVLVLSDSSLQTIASSSSASGSQLEDKLNLDSQAFSAGDVAATALFGGGFFGGNEPSAGSAARWTRPPQASADSSGVGQVLHNAVVSATSAAGDAAQQAAESARRSLEEARNTAASWFDPETRQHATEAADAARHAASEAASAAAHEAKRGAYSLGSLLHERAPGAADAAYKTAQTAGSLASAAAERLSAAANDAKSAFLTWAGQVKEGVQRGSEETLHSASQAAEQAAAAAELARKAAVDAAQRATKAAQEARHSLSVFTQQLQSETAAGSSHSAAAASHHASEQAEQAAQALEEASRATKAALASWSDFLNDAFRSGSHHSEEAASAAGDAAKSVAERLQQAAQHAGIAAGALASATASLVSPSSKWETEKAEAPDALTVDASKPFLQNFLPWASEKSEEAKKAGWWAASRAADEVKARSPSSAEEACDCAYAASGSMKEKAQKVGGYLSGLTGKACDCAQASRQPSILEATKRFFGFRSSAESQAEDALQRAAKAVREAASSATSRASSSSSSADGLGDSLKNAGRRIASAFSSSTDAATDLRPVDAAAWLGNLPTTAGEAREAAHTAAEATGINRLSESLPAVYRGSSILDCDPLPPYKDCIAQCDADDARNAAAEQAGGLSSSEYSKKRACYLACKAKWIDTVLPGCLDASGNVVPGTAPAALFRSTTSTSTSAPASQGLGGHGGASSWSDFLRPLQRKDDSSEVQEKLRNSRFSWFFGDSAPSTTTTTAAPAAANNGMFSGFFGAGRQADPEQQWLHGVDWSGWKNPLTGSKSEEKSLRQRAAEEARRFADAAERKIKGEPKPAKSHTFLLVAAAAVLLFAVIFIFIALRRWESHHREQRVHATERQQIAENSGADIQRPLMQSLLLPASLLLLLFAAAEFAARRRPPASLGSPPSGEGHILRDSSSRFMLCACLSSALHCYAAAAASPAAAAAGAAAAAAAAAASGGRHCVCMYALRLRGRQTRRWGVLLFLPLFLPLLPRPPVVAAFFLGFLSPLVFPPPLL
ncbi:hypothetical protein Efla_001591 [Eimeria flavescens]